MQLVPMHSIVCVCKMSGTKHMSCVASKLKVVEFAEMSGNRRAEMEYRGREKLEQDWRKKMELTMLPRLARSPHS